jgi:rubredoxin
MLCGAAATTCIATPRARHISFYFLRCALLAPNMHSMFSRGGVLGVRWRQGKDGRMKNHGTAPAFAFAPCKVSRLFCPRCRDLIIAATKSQHVSTNEVRHWWACETCGYEFRTSVRWQSSPPQSVSTIEETVPLQSQEEHCPDGISSGV